MKFFSYQSGRLLLALITLAACRVSIRAQVAESRARGGADNPGTSVSTGSVVGVVRDAVTTDPLPGASVQVKGSNQGTVTNTEGAFVLSSVKEGTVVLVVSYIGYKSLEQSVEVQAGQTTRVQLNIQVGEIQLDEITLSENLEGQARALNQQRNAPNVKVIVSADQAGRFPDLNSAEALQRVSGVSITRDNGEGSAVQLRGTPRNFTTISINGEQIPGTNESGNRAEALDIVPADQLASLEVSKAITPDQDGDAIGGNVNLITPLARAQKLRIKTDIGGGYNELNDNLSYIGKLSGEKRFGSSDQFGALISGTYYSTLNGEDRAEYEYRPGPLPNSGYRSDLVDLLPQLLVDHALRDAQNERTRYAINASFDYRIGDEITFFFKSLYSSLEDDVVRRRLRYRPQIVSVADENGDNNAFAGYTTNTLTRPDARVRRDINDRTISRFNWTNSLGFQLNKPKYQLDAEVFYTLSERDLNSFRNTFNLGNQTWIVDKSRVDYPQYDLLTGDDQDPGQYNFTSFETDRILNEGDNLILKANLSIPFKDFIKSGSSGYFKAGGKYRTQNNTRSRNLNVYDALIGGPDNFLLSQVVGNFEDNDFLNGNYVLGPFPSPDRSRQYFSDNSEFFVRNSSRSFFDSESFFYDATESITAAYAMGLIRFTRLTVLAGARVERTLVEYTANLLQFQGADTSVVQQVGENDYTFLLPNLHLKYALDEFTNIRAAVTWSFTRPNFDNVIPSEQIIRPDFEIRRGNPELDPARAINFDLLFEHYFASVGLVSGGVFHKQIDDFIFEERSFEIFEGDPYNVFTFVNGDAASITGVELAFQRSLDFLPGVLKGTGVYFNYTYTRSNSDVGERKNVRFPGQSDHVFNFALFYDYAGFTARASLNYNSSFILRVTDDPLFDDFNDERLQLDVNFTKTFLERKMRVYVELVNLLDQPVRQFRGRSTLPINLEFYSWSARFGVSYRFN